MVERIDHLKSRQSRPWRARFLLLFALVCLAGLNAAAATLTATLDRDSISLGESATLSVAVEGGSPRAAPVLPRSPDWQASSMGTQQEMSIINGRTSSKVIYSYQITPIKTGDITLGVVTVNVDGQVLKSNPLLLHVLPESETPSAGDAKLAFIKIVVPKRQVYLGEVLPVEVQLFLQPGNIEQAPKLPSEGFTIVTSAKPYETRTQVGNAIYSVVGFKMSMTAAKAGALTLGPATCPVNIFVGPRDFFFNSHQTRAVTARGDAVPIEVRPLPDEGKPATFKGAVGQFSMNLTAGPTNVGVGDPITVRVDLNGNGALESLTLPEQDNWREFKLYPPTGKVETTHVLGIQGSKIFEQVVSPLNAGIKTLPPLVFSYFDPEKKRYETLSSAPIPLSVHPTASLPQPSIVADTNAAPEKPATRELAHILPRLGTVSSANAPLASRSLFWILQLAIPFAWLLLVISRKRREAFEKNPKARRRREVASVIQSGLEELDRHAASRDRVAFFSTLFRLLQEQLGERLDMPASGITESVIDERLRRTGLPEDRLAELHQFFQLCNQARYAATGIAEEPSTLLPRFKALLGELGDLEV
jgi:hypothetical protein